MGKARDRKSIFITGAASGMGRETARLFADGGWFVGAYDINEQGLETLESELGPDNCLVGCLDVTDRAAYTKALAEFSAVTDGTLDLLFNNAGIGKAGFFDEQPFEEVMAVVRLTFSARWSGSLFRAWMTRRQV